MSSILPRVARDSIKKLAGENGKFLRDFKKIDPRERYVLLYPDENAAFLGMGFNLLNNRPAEQVYQRASEITNKDILKLCLKGPKTDIYDCMENKQLATFVTSHARMAMLADERPRLIERCKSAGGIGVGFINSLVFSGAMSFENAIELIQQQSRAMDRAAKIVPSACIKIVIKPGTRKMRVCEAAVEHCIKKGIPKEIAVCSVTKQSRPQQIEVSGHEEAIKFLELEGTRLFDFRDFHRIRKNNRAFYCDLMSPVKEYLKVFLNEKLKEQPDYLVEPVTCSVFSATAGYRLRSVDSIKKDLYSYPVRPLKVESLLHCLFARPPNVPQPNVLVLWDSLLMRTLAIVNRPAWSSAKLLRA